MFIVLSVYFLILKVELYESRTGLIVRDTSTVSTASSFGLSLLGAGPSSSLQDSMVVEEYLRSLDVYKLLDPEFNLTAHYKSDKLFILERLRSDATVESTLEFYRDRLDIQYDEISGILHVAYAHTDPVQAKKVLEYLIVHVEKQLNAFNQKKAKKYLKFIETQYIKQKEKMAQSSNKLEVYQNEHLLLDPSNSALSSSSIIASLEAKLTQKKIELSSLRGYLNEKNYDVIRVKSEIKSIQKSLKRKRKSLTGSDANRLNKILFEYEKLKMEAEFDTEIYKNTLIQLEATRLEVSKEAKTLSVVTQPNLPNGYTYPNKPRTFINILIMVLIGYGIVSMLVAIISDHRE